MVLNQELLDIQKKGCCALFALVTSFGITVPLWIAAFSGDAEVQSKKAIFMTFAAISSLVGAVSAAAIISYRRQYVAHLTFLNPVPVAAPVAPVPADVTRLDPILSISQDEKEQQQFSPSV